MTHHYVNLVSAPWIIHNLHKEGKYFCDSITMKWFARLKGYHVERISGVSVVEKILKFENSVVLGKGYIELPFWSSAEEVELTNEIIEAIRESNKVIIGISSPKQDKLALLINEKYSNVEIYCLGAAISNKSPRTAFADKNSLTWLAMLILNPKRFLVKLKSMIKSTLILLKKSNHNKCLELIGSFEEYH